MILLCDLCLNATTDCFNPDWGWCSVVAVFPFSFRIISESSTRLLPLRHGTNSSPAILSIAMRSPAEFLSGLFGCEEIINKPSSWISEYSWYIVLILR